MPPVPLRRPAKSTVAPLAAKARFLLSRAKDYATFSPLLASQFGRAALHCAQADPKALPKSAVQIVCPKCGCPLETDTEERRIVKPLFMHRRRRRALKKRQLLGRQNSKMCLCICRACGGHITVLATPPTKSTAPQGIEAHRKESRMSSGCYTGKPDEAIGT
ncbi:g6717 [Coccomyxa elongata]